MNPISHCTLFHLIVNDFFQSSRVINLLQTVHYYTLQMFNKAHINMGSNRFDSNYILVLYANLS